MDTKLENSSEPGLHSGEAQKDPVDEQRRRFLLTTTSVLGGVGACLLYTSPSPRDGLLSRMPSSA